MPECSLWRVSRSLQSHSFPPSVGGRACNHGKTHYTCVSTYVRWRTFLGTQSGGNFSLHLSDSFPFCRYPKLAATRAFQFRLGSRGSPALDPRLETSVATFDWLRVLLGSPESVLLHCCYRTIINARQVGIMTRIGGGKPRHHGRRFGARLRGIYRTDHRRSKKVGINGGRVQLRK